MKPVRRLRAAALAAGAAHLARPALPAGIQLAPRRQAQTQEIGKSKHRLRPAGTQSICLNRCELAAARQPNWLSKHSALVSAAAAMARFAIVAHFEAMLAQPPTSRLQFEPKLAARSCAAPPLLRPKCESGPVAANRPFWPLGTTERKAAERAGRRPRDGPAGRGRPHARTEAAACARTFPATVLAQPS